MTMRGGDRPKNAHEEFTGTTVMPRSQWEPWLLYREPLGCKTVADNLRKYKTGALRRISDKQPFGDVIKSHPTRKTGARTRPPPVAEASVVPPRRRASIPAPGRGCRPRPVRRVRIHARGRGGRRATSPSGSSRTPSTSPSRRTRSRSSRSSPSLASRPCPRPYPTTTPLARRLPPRTGPAAPRHLGWNVQIDPPLSVFLDALLVEGRRPSPEFTTRVLSEVLDFDRRDVDLPELQRLPLCAAFDHRCRCHTPKCTLSASGHRACRPHRRTSAST